MIAAIKTYVQDTWAHIRHDFRSVTWNGVLLRKALFMTVIFLWTLELVALIFTISYFRLFWVPDATACAPDGKFTLYPEQYDPWSRTGLFQVTIAFGEYSFGMVRTIDVAWDVVRTAHPLSL